MYVNFIYENNTISMKNYSVVLLNTYIKFSVILIVLLRHQIEKGFKTAVGGSTKCSVRRKPIRVIFLHILTEVRPCSFARLVSLLQAAPAGAK